MEAALSVLAQAQETLNTVHGALPAPVLSLLSTLDSTIVSSWSYVVAQTGGEDADYFRLCVLPSLGSVVLFWAFNIPLLFFNFFPNLNPLERWKIQKGRYESFNRVCWMLLTVLVNQGIGMAISASPQNYEATKGRNVLSGTDGLPTFLQLCFQVWACCMLYDLIFFTLHCLMHTKWLYMNVHKVHHQSKITIGISSAYFHPLDYVVSAIAVILPPVICSNHIITMTVWLLVHMCETTNAHMGYEIPFFPSAKDHDFHHSHSYYSSAKYRYVTMGAFWLIPDRIFGSKSPVDEWWEKNPEGITSKNKAPVEGGKGEGEGKGKSD
jgi:sterol desaturase/sphingolipid hydroxylase (fatty acid hydroxylase superfamily)